jgi:hypothetical protein
MPPKKGAIFIFIFEAETQPVARRERAAHIFHSIKFFCFPQSAARE